MRKAFRSGVIVSLGIASGVSVVLLVSVLVGGAEWTGERLAELLGRQVGRASDQFNRLTNCLGVERPQLARVAEPWEVEYSWTGGYGAGDVHFLLTSDGHGTLTFANGRQTQPPVTARVASARVSQIASLIDETNVLCLDPVAREDHHVVDLGRYSIRVSSGVYQKEVFAGECYYLTDPGAFQVVCDAIEGLADVFGDELTRGPRGITTLEGPCNE